MPGVQHQEHVVAYTVQTTDGDVHPIDIGDLGDGDNYEYLYLDTEAKPLRVSMKAGIQKDPRADPNSFTIIEVASPVFR